MLNNSAKFPQLLPLHNCSDLHPGVYYSVYTPVQKIQKTFYINWILYVPLFLFVHLFSINHSPVETAWLKTEKWTFHCTGKESDSPSHWKDINECSLDCEYSVYGVSLQILVKCNTSLFLKKKKSKYL